MQNSPLKLFFLTTVGFLSLSSASLAQEQTAIDPKNDIYRSQMAVFPAINKELPNLVEKTTESKAVPADDKEIYHWQLEKYPTLKDEFGEALEKNIAATPVPETPEEIYLWQLEKYKELDKEFHDAHRREYLGAPLNSSATPANTKANPKPFVGP